MDSRTSWPALIGALIKGETLAADETAWAMNEIMDGAATPAQIAGFGVALRMKGETAASSAAWPRPCSTTPSPISYSGPHRRPGRHRRRRRAHGQHLHDGHHRRGGGRAPGWSSTATARPPRRAARRTCSRRWASSSTSRRPPSRSGWRPRPGSPSCSRRSTTRRCGTSSVPRRELGVPTVFNFLGPVANPARPGRAGGGRGRPADGPDPGRRAGQRAAARRWSSTASDGLDELTTTGTVRWSGWCTTAPSARPGSTRRRSGFARSRSRRTCAAASGSTTPAVARAVLAASAGPGAGDRAAERRRRRWRPRRACPDLRRWRPRSRPATSGRRRRARLRCRGRPP